MNLIENQELTTPEHVQAHIHVLKKLLVIQNLRPVHTSNCFVLFVLLLYLTIIRADQGISINTWHIKSQIPVHIVHIHCHISYILTNDFFIGR